MHLILLSLVVVGLGVSPFLSSAQTTSKKKATGVSAAQKAAASAAIPVMADTGMKLPPSMSISLPGLPVKLARRIKPYSAKSHRTKDRIPLQISLPPLLVQQMKTVKLLKGVSMVDQIIHCMEAAGYEVDDTAKAAMSKRYSSE